MSAALHQTFSDLTRALSPKPGLLPQTRPVFLRDVLDMKRERGDSDCDAFKAVAREFASGTYATISGAIWAMDQWIKHRDAGKQKHIAQSHQEARRAFVADCRSVQAGTFGVEFKARAA